jgi:glycosyltransferase involved in cell wall biosynthesis
MTRVSVITVVRNGAGQLADNLASVAAQTHEPLEHLVLDGASTDGTVEVLKRHAHPRLRWWSEPDRGIYQAMNKGISRSTGDWLLFLNADDRFADPEAVARLLSGVSARGGGERIYYGDHELFSRESPMAPIRVRARWRPRLGMTICHQSTLYPRSVFTRIGPYPEDFRLAGDFAHAVACHREGIPFVHVPTVVAQFCVDGSTRSNMDRSYDEAESVVRAAWGAWAAWRFRTTRWTANGRKAGGWLVRQLLGPRAYARVRRSWLQLRP